MFLLWAQIRVLVRCGAHLTKNLNTIGDMLCNAAARGNLVRLNSLLLAGVDFNQTDVSDRSAIHLAVQHRQVLSWLHYVSDTFSDCSLIRNRASTFS